MIVIFNLNEYVGGGETLAVRFAEYVRDRGDDYCLLVAAGECWLAREASRKGLEFILWPTAQRSVTYMHEEERREACKFIERTFGSRHQLRVFSFCFRDLYNAVYFFGSVDGPDIKLSHGIYHAEDVLYLSSFSAYKNAIIKVNRRLARGLIDHGSMLFMNSIGCCYTLGVSDLEWAEDQYGRFFHPIPITIKEPIPVRRAPHGSETKVICISRFVEFKIAAVLAIMRTVASMRYTSLTVVGHGPFKWLIDIWMFVRRPANIRVLTGLGPDELDAVIDAHDVGYAQGTAILEIGKRGLPVIIAPYSKLRDLASLSHATLGVFGDIQGARAFGELRSIPRHLKRDLREMLLTVIRDYENYSNLTRRYVYKFDSERVFPEVRSFILNAAYDPRTIAHDLPRPAFLKRLVSRVIGKG
jgi:hypothetical protein